MKARITTNHEYMNKRMRKAIEDFKRIEAESLFEDIDLEQCVMAFMKYVMVFDPKCFKVEWCEE